MPNNNPNIYFTRYEMDPPFKTSYEMKQPFKHWRVTYYKIQSHPNSRTTYRNPNRLTFDLNYMPITKRMEFLAEHLIRKRINDFLEETDELYPSEVDQLFINPSVKTEEEVIMPLIEALHKEIEEAAIQYITDEIKILRRTHTPYEIPNALAHLKTDETTDIEGLNVPVYEIILHVIFDPERQRVWVKQSDEDVDIADGHYSIGQETVQFYLA